MKPMVHRRAYAAIACMLSLTACSASSGSEAGAGSGVTIDIRSIIQGFADAGTIVVASVRSVWTDAQERAADIAEGAEKIQEGKEQMERGVLGE